MTTRRLEQESPEFGRRVTGARKGGRPRTAPNYALIARVRAVKERFDAARLTNRFALPACGVISRLALG